MYEFNKSPENFNETRHTIVTLKQGLDEYSDMCSDTSCCILSEIEKDAANNSNTSLANVTTDTNTIPPIIDHLKETPKGKALSAGCRNLCDNKVFLKKYSSCRVLEGTCQFTDIEWNEFMAANNKYYVIVLRRKITKHINNTCSLAIKNRRRYNIMFSPTPDLNYFKKVTFLCRGKGI